MQCAFNCDVISPTTASKEVTICGRSDELKKKSDLRSTLGLAMKVLIVSQRDERCRVREVSLARLANRNTCLSATAADWIRTSVSVSSFNLEKRRVRNDHWVMIEITLDVQIEFGRNCYSDQQLHPPERAKRFRKIWEDEDRFWPLLHSKSPWYKWS